MWLFLFYVLGSATFKTFVYLDEWTFFFLAFYLARVQPGECYHLYSQLQSSLLIDYQLPEMLRTPLDELCLQIKVSICHVAMFVPHSPGLVAFIPQMMHDSVVFLFWHVRRPGMRFFRLLSEFMFFMLAWWGKSAVMFSTYKEILLFDQLF